MSQLKGLGEKGPAAEAGEGERAARWSRAAPLIQVYARSPRPRANRVPSPSDQWSAALHSRICKLCRPYAISQVALLTGTNPETARRYLRGLSSPSPEFLAALCEAFDVSADWVLRGIGTPHKGKRPG